MREKIVCVRERTPIKLGLREVVERAANCVKVVVKKLTKVALTVAMKVKNMETYPRLDSRF